MCWTDTLVDLYQSYFDEALGAVLAATSSRPVRVQDISEKSKVSRATIYRRINTLCEAGLLAKESDLDEQGNTFHQYESKFSQISITISHGQIEVTVTRDQTTEQRTVVKYDE